DQFLIFYVCGYLLNTLLYLKIIRKTVSYKINVPFEVPKKEKKSIIKFSAAIFSTGVAGTLLSNIDIIMIGAIAPIVMGFDGIELAGIYGRMAFMAILILIPMRSVMNIAVPVISAAWQQGDQKELGSIYSKSSLTMSVIGVFTFLGIWINIDSVFLIFPEGFEVGKYAFLFLAIGNLIQAAMGANGAIIWNSSYYWLSSITVPLLALSIVIGNLIFIPKYGLIGAAVATAASRLIFAIITFLFLLIKYKMQPFSWRHLYTFGIAFGVILIVSYIPLFEHLILDIAIRSIVASILFIPAILLPKISPDINGTAHKLLNRLNSKK
ncbi:MAG: polysaccharide biosynthesis protein, partial [Crocinitomicaceae bacterium]|nr:polysaccharide biosynthesis protein [Crocinitomicaceae bacterium]